MKSSPARKPYGSTTYMMVYGAIIVRIIVLAYSIVKLKIHGYIPVIITIIIFSVIKICHLKVFNCPIIASFRVR